GAGGCSAFRGLLSHARYLVFGVSGPHRLPSDIPYGGRSLSGSGLPERVRPSLRRTHAHELGVCPIFAIHAIPPLNEPHSILQPHLGRGLCCRYPRTTPAHLPAESGPV